MPLNFYSARNIGVSIRAIQVLSSSHYILLNFSSPRCVCSEEMQTHSRRFFCVYRVLIWGGPAGAKLCQQLYRKLDSRRRWCDITGAHANHLSLTWLLLFFCSGAAPSAPCVIPIICYKAKRRAQIKMESDKGDFCLSGCVNFTTCFSRWLQLCKMCAESARMPIPFVPLNTFESMIWKQFSTQSSSIGSIQFHDCVTSRHHLDSIFLIITRI